MGNNRDWKRRIHLVNKPLQFSYMALTIWILLNGIIITGALTYYFTLNSVLTQIEVVGEVHFDAQQLGANVTSMVLKRVGPAIVFIIILAGLLDILYLHRVAGPAYRIEKVIQDLSKGKNACPIRLRKKDFLKSLADSVNELALYYRERDERVQALLTEAKEFPALEKRIEELQAFFPDLTDKKNRSFDGDMN